MIRYRRRMSPHLVVEHHAEASQQALVLEVAPGLGGELPNEQGHGLGKIGQPLLVLGERGGLGIGRAHLAEPLQSYMGELRNGQVVLERPEHVKKKKAAEHGHKLGGALRHALDLVAKLLFGWHLLDGRLVRELFEFKCELLVSLLIGGQLVDLALGHCSPLFLVVGPLLFVPKHFAAAHDRLADLPRVIDPVECSPGAPTKHMFWCWGRRREGGRKGERKDRE